MRDVWIVLKKELKELLRLHGSAKRTLSLMLLPLFVIGAIFAMTWNKQLLNSPGSVAFSVVIPLGMVIAVICDSFAGERERHTLETLLASRLPDSAILFGKMGAAMAFGWILTVLIMVFMRFAALVAKGPPESWGYLLGWHAGALAFALPLWGLWAGLGVLVSLRSPTVKRAQQTLSISFLLICVLPAVLVGSSPSLQRRIGGTFKFLEGVRPTTVLLWGIVVLLLVDVVLILAAMARFKRSRLILD